MKLQRFRSRQVGQKEYFKWVLNPPGDSIETLKWGEGDELEATPKDGELVIRRASKARPKSTDAIRRH